MVTYESASGAAIFSIKFDEEIEITGNMGAYLWVSPLEVRDMDLIVKLRKLDTSGNVVYFDHCHAPGHMRLPLDGGGYPGESLVPENPSRVANPHLWRSTICATR